MEVGDKIFKGHVTATVVEKVNERFACVRFEHGMGCADGICDYIDTSDWKVLGYGTHRPSHSVQIEPADSREEATRT